MFDPQSNETIGYHLFLVPPEPVITELRIIIETLAKKYGGPVFLPHTTLLARIPRDDESAILEKARLVAKNLTPLTLTLKDFGEEESFFRAFFIKFAPSKELLLAHRQALDVFGIEDANKYLPHLSLLYGDFPLPVKDSIRASVTLPSTHEFKVTSLHVFKTEGITESWEHVAEYAFGNGSS